MLWIYIREGYTGRVVQKTILNCKTNEMSIGVCKEVRKNADIILEKVLWLDESKYNLVLTESRKCGEKKEKCIN